MAGFQIPAQFQATVWGPAANQIQADAQGLLSQAESYIQTNAKDTLGKLASTAGITPSQLSRAAASIDQYGMQAVASVGKLVSGGQMHFMDVAPIVAMGLAATGVGAAAGAAVAVVAGALDAIADLVNAPPQLDPNHQWYLPDGTVRTVPTGRPGGPDAKDWTTWEDWIGGLPKGSSGMLPAKEPGYPMYDETIGWEITRLQALLDIQDGKSINVPGLSYSNGQLAGIDSVLISTAEIKNIPRGLIQFYIAYYKAWQKAFEFAINGYTFPQPWAIFASTMNSWNAAHAGPSVSLVATTHGRSQSIGLPNDPGGSSYIGQLLNGDLDGVHHVDDISQLNIGPVAGHTVVLKNPRALPDTRALTAAAFEHLMLSGNIAKATSIQDHYTPKHKWVGAVGGAVAGTLVLGFPFGTIIGTALGAAVDHFRK